MTFREYVDGNVGCLATQGTNRRSRHCRIKSVTLKPIVAQQPPVPGWPLGSMAASNYPTLGWDEKIGRNGNFGAWLV